MKSNVKKIMFLYLTLTIILFNSCNPNDDGINDASNFSNNFGATTSKDFIGRVVNVNNYPIPNATIQIGNSTVQTDVNGMFIINGATVYEKFAYITAKKSGYIDGSRALVPTNGSNTVNIMLFSNTPTATVNSGVVSEVSLSSGTKVKFDGAFQTENGTAYSGAVQVLLNEIKSSNPNRDKLMPGMLFAQDSEGKAKLLETFGMINVELKGSGGQKLQIASGHTAEITMDIDSSQLASSPTTIPLWHFDEINGYWKQEGTATKTGNKYVGTVSHFSWWNYDISIDFAYLSATVLDNAGNPLSDVRIEIVRPNLSPRSAYSNTDGEVSGIVPANETLTIKAYDRCGIIFFSSSIGPFATGSSNTLSDIIIPSTTLTNVIGSLKKCDNSNVTNGYVLMNASNRILYAAVTNGNFSINTLYCPTDMNFTLQGFDSASIQTTGTINNVFTPITTNVGNITTCNNALEYIAFQIDSNPTYAFYDNHVDAVYDPILYIFGGNIAATTGIDLIGQVNTVGTYTTNQFTIELNDYENGTVFIDSSTPNSISFNLTNAGPTVGSYVDMTFNGTFTDVTGTHTISGTVHAIRSF